ncbi:MAG: sigma-54-dependent Fis family transcriptional regulator [Nitrospira sp.]|nr:sigma-54-dependent Fis family transcriptional regulator [Nitrospira sp.]
MNILIVDDEPDILEGLGDALTAEGHHPTFVSCLEEAWTHVQQQSPDFILLDLTLPDGDGLTLLERLGTSTRPTQPHLKDTLLPQEGILNPPVIIMTAFGTVEKAVRSMKLGAIDVLTKPFDIDHVCLLMARATEHRALLQEVAYLREEIDSPYAMIVGEGHGLMAVKDLARQAAQTDGVILLLGETGTGKELLGRMIHRWSPRHQHPFMVINCAGMPETLLENELFGHERGAFTGADRQQPGKLEAAKGGTVFLDEIGDMPLTLQTRLLRVIQDREFHRIGGVKTIKAQVRFLAATNVELWKAVQAGTFREDLFFRLNVFPIQLPPLRERLEDLTTLVPYLMHRHARTFKKPSLHVSPETMSLLRTYRWPGNIRELDNVLARAALLTHDETIQPEALHFLQDPSGGPSSAPINADTAGATFRQGPYKEMMDHYARTLILTALEGANNNKSLAARTLGLSRSYFAKLLSRYRL